MKKSQSCTHLQDFEKNFDLKNYTSYDSVSNADFKYIIFIDIKRFISKILIIKKYENFKENKNVGRCRIRTHNRVFVDCRSTIYAGISVCIRISFTLKDQKFDLDFLENKPARAKTAKIHMTTHI